MERTEVVIVGSGLAGLVVAINLFDTTSCKVVVLEKEANLGLGNSIKASSGINCALDPEDVATFRSDTITSAGEAAQPHLIEPLIRESAEALTWLRDRLQVDLSSTAQLGGHQAARTYRPSGKLPIGAEIMGKIRLAVTEELGERVSVRTNARAMQLRTDEKGHIMGVEYEDTQTKERKSIFATHVVLATGGYAASPELLAKYRPDLTKFPATQGPFSTGDGLQLGQQVEAACIDLEEIQVHPTGFVDPKDPDNPNKFLCAEVLRGVGGLLLGPDGTRFCDELGLRDYMTDKFLSLDATYASTKKWSTTKPIPKAFLVLPARATESIIKHIEFYSWKGFLRKVIGSKGIAQVVGCSTECIDSTIQRYQEAAAQGKDEFGKTRFVIVPHADEEVYVGIVTPVLHYCMGGLSFDPQGRVLCKNGEPIGGLLACGEVAGGVHGANRLAGNSLCECVVYGRIVAKTIRASLK